MEPEKKNGARPEIMIQSEMYKDLGPVTANSIRGMYDGTHWMRFSLWPLPGTVHSKALLCVCECAAERKQATQTPKYTCWPLNLN